MAKILYEVKKNQNTSSSAYGKWFAQIKTLETLNTRKLAQQEDTFIFDEDEEKKASETDEYIDFNGF